MAEKEASEKPLKRSLWGYRGLHFAPHSCVVDSIHRHLLTDLRDAALPHHLTKYTPPGWANRRCNCDSYCSDTLGGRLGVTWQSLKRYPSNLR